MSQPILIADRISRTQGHVLESLVLTRDRCRELAEDNIGLFAGGVLGQSLLRHVCWMVRNAAPCPVAVACSDYESVEQVSDGLHELDRHVVTYRYDEEPDDPITSSSVVVTVPERLHALKETIRLSQWHPLALIQVDPEGWSHRIREWNGWTGSRAENIGRLRGACMAIGSRPLIVRLSCAPVASISLDHLIRDLAVESIYYLKGTSLRTAGISNLVMEGEATTHLAHPIDNIIQRHYATRAQTLVIVRGMNAAQSDVFLRSFAEQRGYPILDLQVLLKPLVNGPETQASVGQAKEFLEQAIRQANKRIILLLGIEWLSHLLGPLAAVGLLASTGCESLLLGSAGRETEAWDPAEPLTERLASILPIRRQVVVETVAELTRLDHGSR